MSEAFSDEFQALRHSLNDARGMLSTNGFDGGLDSLVKEILSFVFHGPLNCREDDLLLCDVKYVLGRVEVW